MTSGRSRIPGTRTRMELAWQKEREEQQRLIQESSTLARDLRQTLLEVRFFHGQVVLLVADPLDGVVGRKRTGSRAVGGTSPPGTGQAQHGRRAGGCAQEGDRVAERPAGAT